MVLKYKAHSPISCHISENPSKEAGPSCWENRAVPHTFGSVGNLGQDDIHGELPPATLQCQVSQGLLSCNPSLKRIKMASGV